MKRIAIAALAATLLAGVTPAFAKEDCNAGYKDFIGKMSSHMSNVSGNELAEYVRKSLGAYDSCMFFDATRILAVRQMILADDEAGRRKALAKILPMQREDFEQIFKIMREANRSYDANLQTIKQTRDLISSTIDLLKSQ